LLLLTALLLVITALAQLALSGVNGPHSSSFCEPEYIAQQRNLVRNEVALELFSCQRYAEVSFVVQYILLTLCAPREPFDVRSRWLLALQLLTLGRH
jgi:hypothetical protein